MKNRTLDCGILFRMTMTLWIAFSVTMVCSCRSKEVEDMKPGGQSTVVISIKDIVFDGEEELKTKSSGVVTKSRVYEKTIELPEGMSLLAELSVEEKKASIPTVKASSNKDILAAATPLKPNIRYKVVVYKADGTYVVDKDYVRGQESVGGDMMLDGDKTYTFIVYSVNSTSALPSVTFSNVNAKTLATSNVLFNGTDDVMYYKKEMTVSGNIPNYIEVVLKHKLSQITTTIDASATGYNVTTATSHVTRHNSTGSLSLADGSLMRTGTVGNSTVSFPTLNTLKVESTPTIINANSNNTTSYQISVLTIGPLTVNNITPFTDLVITPGVKYNMKLTIIPEDIFLTEQGIPAARINGQIWMRHNVGVVNTLNADQNPSIAALHGNYYQWGRSAVVANTSTSVAAIAGWDGSTTQPANLWNIGTESAPKKSTSDPCPPGFRIPTHTEQLALVVATIQTDLGTSGSSPTNYSAAKVFTSKKNANVKLTFPLAGNRKFDTGELVNRGANGFYWSSSVVGGNTNRRHHYGLSFGNPPSEGTSVPSWGFPVRCIKE